jgi:uncharacterized membrane protein YhdT
MPISLVPEFILLYLVLCAVAAYLGRHRRIGFWGFFFLSLIATPILTSLFIYVAAPVRRRHSPAPRHR